jgi:hypothetical protein
MHLVFVYKLELTALFYYVNRRQHMAEQLMNVPCQRSYISDFVDDYDLTFVENLQTKLVLYLNLIGCVGTKDSMRLHCIRNHQVIIILASLTFALKFAKRIKLC